MNPGDAHMFIRDWKTEIRTIPNLLSLVRLMLIPVYILIYLHATEPRQYFTAGAILAVSCLTDALDGWIARRFHMITNLGKLLDPVADKVTQFSLILCLSMKYREMIPILVLFAIKELFQIGAALYHLNLGEVLPGALTAGKICTAILFATLVFLVLFPSVDPETVTWIAMADGLFLVISFGSYLFTYLGKPSGFQQL